MTTFSLVSVNMNILTVLIVRHLKLHNVMLINMFFSVWSYLTTHVWPNLKSHCSTQPIGGGGIPYLSSSLHSCLWTFLKSLTSAPCFYGLLRELWIMSLSHSTFFCNYSTISIQALGIHAEQNRITFTCSGIKV